MPEHTANEKATFIVEIQFSQNATWQGTLSWTEQKKTQHFRSALEMLKMMDEAVSAQNSPEAPAMGEGESWNE